MEGQSLERFRERGGVTAAIEWFGEMPQDVETILGLFGKDGQYEGMLDEETIKIIRQQIPATATEENLFGDNITFDPYPDDGYFVEVTCFKEGE